MAQQDERNYLVQQIKVLNWLLEYRSQNPNSGLTFHLSTNQGAQFPFPGRGKSHQPRRDFYLDLISASGYNSRYYLRLIVFLNADYSAIERVKLSIGINAEQGGRDVVMSALSPVLQFNEGETSQDVVRGGQDDAIREAIYNLITGQLCPNVYQSLGGIRERVIAEEDFVQELRHSLDILTRKNLVTIHANGLVDINPLAEFSMPDAEDAVEEDDGEGHQEMLAMKRNKIIFGAPGTGKSYSLKAAYTGEDSPFYNRYERVTFYPTYSYAQFVGSYKPIMRQTNGEEKISYQFIPGPFLRQLVRAVNDPDHDYLLIVEEINRANAAAVFGDVFQILDRGDDGESEYSIGASEDIIRYLQGTVGQGGPVLSPEAKRFFGMATADDEPTGDCVLKLPNNFYIWATMNSADQGVFPLDTAFKRRWEFEYLRLDAGENADGCAAWVLAGRGYRWNEVRRLINAVLSAQGVNEDKLMGPFFVKAARDQEGNHLPISQEAFESKVLMYLWEDAARMCRRQIFGDVKTYSQLLDKWEDDGLAIFSPALERDERLRRDYGNLVYPPAQNPEPNAQ